MDVPVSQWDQDDFLERSILWWHLIFAAIVLITGLLLVIDGHPRSLAILAVLPVLYAVLLVPVMHGVVNTRRATYYLIAAYAVFAVLMWIDSSSMMLLFALCPQTFATLKTTRAVVYLSALIVVLARTDSTLTPSRATRTMVASARIVRWRGRCALMVGQAIELSAAFNEVTRPREAWGDDYRHDRMAWLAGAGPVDWESPRDAFRRFDRGVREAASPRGALVIATHGMVLTNWLHGRGILTQSETAPFWSRLGFPELLRVDLELGTVDVVDLWREQTGR